MGNGTFSAFWRTGEWKFVNENFHGKWKVAKWKVTFSGSISEVSGEFSVSLISHSSHRLEWLPQLRSGDSAILTHPVLWIFTFLFTFFQSYEWKCFFSYQWDSFASKFRFQFQWIQTNDLELFSFRLFSTLWAFYRFLAFFVIVWDCFGFVCASTFFCFDFLEWMDLSDFVFELERISRFLLKAISTLDILFVNYFF